MINIQSNAKYLRITMHDNDYTGSLEYAGETLKQIFEFEGKYPTDEDLQWLKEMVKHIWYSTHNTIMKLQYKDYTISSTDLFRCNLEFVDYLDIPDWDNHESIYIPMFENADIIMR